MKDNARYLELSDEELEQVVGGSGRRGQSIDQYISQSNSAQIYQHVEAKYVAIAIAIAPQLNINIPVNVQVSL